MVGNLVSMNYLATIVNEIRRGNVDQARDLLIEHLKEQVDDVEGWYLLSHLALKREHQLRALHQVLRYSPEHTRAQSRLKLLRDSRLPYDAGESALETACSTSDSSTDAVPSDSNVSRSRAETSFSLKPAAHSTTLSAGLSEAEWKQIAWELVEERLECELHEPVEDDLPDLVRLFFDDVKQLPIISNKSQQFWLGAHLLAPMQLQKLERPLSAAELVETIVNYDATLEELCTSNGIRPPRIGSWIGELQQARRNIYRLKRSRVRRFFRRLPDDLAEDRINSIKSAVYDLVELLCLLPGKALQHVSGAVSKEKAQSAISVLLEWLEYSDSKISEDELEARAKQRRNEAKKTLALGYLRYGLRIASNYVGEGVPFVDLVQEAFLGLLRGAEKFNYREYEQFGHYGTTWVWQRVTRAIAMKGRAIRLPVHMGEQVKKLDKAEREFATGNKPVWQDLEVLTGLDLLEKQEAQQIESADVDEPLPASVEKKYQKTKQKVKRWHVWRYDAQSLDAIALQLSSPPDSDDDWVELLQNQLLDRSSPLPGSNIERIELRHEMLELLQSLVRSNRDYQILCYRFGMEDGVNHTLEEVGAKFELTRERVRQIVSRALEIAYEKLTIRPSNVYEASWLDSLLASEPRLLSVRKVTFSRYQDDALVKLEKRQLGKLIDGLPRGSRLGERWDQETTWKVQLKEALRSLGSPAHYQDIFDAIEEDLDDSQLRSAYQALSNSDDVFMLLGEGCFSLVDWELERAKEKTPILPFCPQPLPDPPDYEDAFFEAVLVAHHKLTEKPMSADRLINEMLAWAQIDEDVPRWRKQAYVSAYYVVGLIPYVYLYGGENRVVKTELPDLSVRELRTFCLNTLTERVEAMPQFWWLLASYAPARPTDLGEELSEVHPAEIDDALHRLYLLAGLGAVRRLDYGRYELTPLGMELASRLGSSQKFAAAIDDYEGEVHDGFSALTFDW